MQVIYVVDVEGLGDRVRAARLADGRQVTQLAALAGVSVMTWHRIEGEKQATPIGTLKRVEAALGVPLDLPDGPMATD